MSLPIGPEFLGDWYRLHSLLGWGVFLFCMVAGILELMSSVFYGEPRRLGESTQPIMYGACRALDSSRAFSYLIVDNFIYECYNDFSLTIK